MCVLLKSSNLLVYYFLVSCYFIITDYISKHNMRYPANLIKSALNASFCDLTIFKLGMLVNERRMNNRCEYCVSLGLGM